MGKCEIGLRCPGGTAGDLLKSEFLIKMDGARVVVTDVKPEGGCPFGAGMVNGALGEDTRDAVAAMVGMYGDVGDQVDAFAPVTEWDEAGIAYDLVVLLPDKAREWQGCGLGHVVRPMQEAVVTAGAAHICHVTLTVIVHGAGKAQFNEVGNGRQVAENIERPHLRVLVRLGGDADGAH